MKFKFGTPVKIKNDPFYNNSQGIVLEYDSVDLRYQVLLNFNQIRYFYADNLIKIKRITK